MKEVKYSFRITTKSKTIADEVERFLRSIDSNTIESRPTCAFSFEIKEEVDTKEDDSACLALARPVKRTLLD